MKKNFIIAGLLVAGLYSAQQAGSVGINVEPVGATLDVEINKDAGYDKTVGQGIAVPRVSKQELSEMTGTIAEGALVYVNEIGTATGRATARVVDVTTANGIGFYYFNGKSTESSSKWVKVGSLVSPISINSGGANREVVQEVTSLTAADWHKDDFMKVLVNGFSGTVDLPPASQNKNRVISVQNISGAGKNYASANAPKNVGTINSQRAHFLISNGTNWYMIGGIGQ